jgi:hypothetical protein
MFQFLLMFWLLSIERLAGQENNMHHLLLILISFRILVRALSCLHMPRLLQLHWWTYAPSPHLQSLGHVTILVLKYSLMMKRNKLMFRTFLEFFAFDCIALVFD